MRRVVKAWVVLNTDKPVRSDWRDPDFWSRPLAVYTSRAAARKRLMGCLFETPCTITYDAGKPRRAARGGKRG